MTANEALARRWLASKHWGGWRAGMVDVYGAVAILVDYSGEEVVFGDTDGRFECPGDTVPSLPDLDHPGTRAFLLEDARRALGFLVSCPFSDDGGRTWHLWSGRQCFSGDTEAEALIAALEAALGE